LEIITQIDGATVGVKEAKEFVSGKIRNSDVAGIKTGEPLILRAIEFTKGGDEDDVTVQYKGQNIKLKKKYIEPTELFEYGVYNSETDTNNNPKTGENTPDAVQGVIDRVSERIKEIVSTLDELRLFVKDNSNLSHESIDSTITELSNYIKSMEDEGKEASSSSVN